MTSPIQQPLVSVVIATYNGENFLGRQIDSILSQTYSNIEIIIVDDKSTDNTGYLIKNYAAKHPTIQFFANEKKLGYSKSFEHGFLVAKGEFIAPCDQDNVWDIDKIRILVNEMGSHEIVFSNAELIDANGEKLHKKLSDITQLQSFDNCLNYFFDITIPGHTMLVKKELLLRCVPFPSIVSYSFWLGFVATCKGAIKFYSKVLVLDRQYKNLQDTYDNKNTATQTILLAQQRIKLLYDHCPETLFKEKKVLLKIFNSYQNFSLKNNCNRLFIFLKYRHQLLAHTKKSSFLKWLFCFKMFGTIK